MPHSILDEKVMPGLHPRDIRVPINRTTVPEIGFIPLKKLGDRRFPSGQLLGPDLAFEKLDLQILQFDQGMLLVSGSGRNPKSLSIHPVVNPVDSVSLK